MKTDDVVEAPARLTTVVERNVFASATGTVAELRVAHGDLVAAGQPLVVLADPELALQLHQTRGELEAARQRIDALGVARTDRRLRDDERPGGLPVAAEMRELQERLAALERRRDLLQQRDEALVLRSPCAGQVLTREVEGLLASRPVERGEALLTIADLESGWQLAADVPQRGIGRVVAAMAANEEPIAAEFRLAGDVTRTHRGHVVAVDAAAPLEGEGLRDEPPPVAVRIAVDELTDAAARPGMRATVRIPCGRRSLGYVWLRDVGATVYRWLTF